MPRNYKTERDAIVRRWYGDNSQPENPKPARSWAEGPIATSDCLGIPMPVNSPFMPCGHCLMWRYALNSEGYGTLTIDGKRELAHRAVYVQTRGRIPEGKQVNHLCDRPYCVQPSHLYAGTIQDNKDDSRIFRSEELTEAPWALLWSEGEDTDNPLLRRLLESNRYDGTEPWEPLERPAQRSFEEFTCPGHDFAIPMSRGGSRTCRICEAAEVDEAAIDDHGTLLLIAEICPISQTVVPIFEKIASSEFLRDSYREMRLRAHRRRNQGFGNDSHYLRSCQCDYCIRDRNAFRSAIRPVLSREESLVLDICDRLEPQITGALREASRDMMEGYAKAMGLNEDQAQALREHYSMCVNTGAERISTSRVIEGELGYFLYAVVNFKTQGEMLQDDSFRLSMHRLNLVRLRKEDEEPTLTTIMPVAEVAASRLAQICEREADDLTRPYLESKPELYQDIRRLARNMVGKQVLEHLRYEFLGRNSFGGQEPHPHADCATRIMETGRAEPFSAPFVEGMGYRSGEA